MYVPHRAHSISFAELLDRVADINPEMRIRFTSPHPKDFSDDVLKVSTPPSPPTPQKNPLSGHKTTCRLTPDAGGSFPWHLMDCMQSEAVADQLDSP